MNAIARSGRGWRRMATRATALALLGTALGAAAPAGVPATFHNPILPGGGQDPSILRWNGAYYLVQSRGGVIRVYRSPTLTGLGTATPTAVWAQHQGLPDLTQLWAPEIVALDGKVYIYFAASHGGAHTSRRMYVIEADRPDGLYRFKGQISDPSNRWAIDGSVLEQGGQRYFVWSGWHDDRPNTGQQLYIAPMANPWTIAGPRKLLSSPDARWERIGPEPINEGPEALHHDGRLFLVYSASHCFTDDYCLGLLSYDGHGDVTDRRSWSKSNGCVFAKNVVGGVFGPGHDTLVASPDGTETWNVYHAIATSGCGWKCRTVRMQKVTWRADGTPDFGVPTPLAEPIPVPSGE